MRTKSCFVQSEEAQLSDAMWACTDVTEKGLLQWLQLNCITNAISWTSKRFQCILCTPDNLTGNDRLYGVTRVYSCLCSLSNSVYMYTANVWELSPSQQDCGPLFSLGYGVVCNTWFVWCTTWLVTTRACESVCLFVRPSVCQLKIFRNHKIYNYKADLLNPIITKKLSKDMYIPIETKAVLFSTCMSSSDFHIWYRQPLSIRSTTRVQQRPGIHRLWTRVFTGVL